MEHDLVDGFWNDASYFLLFLLLVFRIYLENTDWKVLYGSVYYKCIPLLFKKSDFGGFLGKFYLLKDEGREKNISIWVQGAPMRLPHQFAKFNTWKDYPVVQLPPGKFSPRKMLHFTLIKFSTAIKHPSTHIDICW